MFGKTSSHSSNTTIIGRGAHFTGTLELEGDAHVEGQCEGTIRAQTQLSVGQHGSVTGELSAGVVVIAGRVEGTTIARETLHVLSTGSLAGDVFYGRLQVDSGGVIDGRTHQAPPSTMLTPSMAPGSARELEAEVQTESVVVDARPRLSSVAPPTAEIARSNAPGKR
jgi:cytoskeletal protein CcmA (bactofilin family)